MSSIIITRTAATMILPRTFCMLHTFGFPKCGQVPWFFWWNWSVVRAQRAVRTEEAPPAGRGGGARRGTWASGVGLIFRGKGHTVSMVDSPSDQVFSWQIRGG